MPVRHAYCNRSREALQPRDTLLLFVYQIYAFLLLHRNSLIHSIGGVRVGFLAGEDGTHSPLPRCRMVQPLPHIQIPGLPQERAFPGRCFDNPPKPVGADLYRSRRTEGWQYVVFSEDVDETGGSAASSRGTTPMDLWKVYRISNSNSIFDTRVGVVGY